MSQEKHIMHPSGIGVAYDENGKPYPPKAKLTVNPSQILTPRNLVLSAGALTGVAVLLGCAPISNPSTSASSEPESNNGNPAEVQEQPTKPNPDVSVATKTIDAPRPTDTPELAPTAEPSPTPMPEGSLLLSDYNKLREENKIGSVTGAAEAAAQAIEIILASKAEELIPNYANLTPAQRTEAETNISNLLNEKSTLNGGTGIDGVYRHQISIIYEVGGENVMFTPRLDREGRITGVVDEIHETVLQRLGLNMSDVVFDPNALPIIDDQENLTGWIADFVIPGIESGRPAGILSRQTTDGVSAINLIPGNYTPDQATFLVPEVPGGEGEILWYMNSNAIGRAFGYDLEPDMVWEGGEWKSVQIDFESVVYEENVVTPIYIVDGDLEINPNKKEEMFRETWEAWAASAFSRDYLMQVYGYIPTTIEQIQDVQYESLPPGQLPLVINEGEPNEVQFPLIFFNKQQLRLINLLQREDEAVLNQLRTTGISTKNMGFVGYDRQRTVNNTNNLANELDELVGGYGQIASGSILGFGLSLTPDGRMVINSGSSSLVEYPHLKNVIVRGEGDTVGDATAMTFLWESLILVLREGQPNVVICSNVPGQKDSNCDGYPQLALLNGPFTEKYGDPDNPNIASLPFRPSTSQ